MQLNKLPCNNLLKTYALLWGTQAMDFHLADKNILEIRLRLHPFASHSLFLIDKHNVGYISMNLQSCT